MTTLRFAWILFAFVTAPLLAVPSLINYQGYIKADGAAFNGEGQFKFALVDAAGTVTYWSHDGTSVGGSEPSSAIDLAVTDGSFSVTLGDTSVSNMTSGIPASVFGHEDVRLRIWFNDGSHGSQRLAPDQRIAAVAYAMIANDVPNGSITAAKLAVGAVGNTQLAPGAAAANLNNSGLGAVASGGIILSATENSALTSSGYTLLTTTALADGWFQGTITNAHTAVYRHTAVWTGSEMIVWGGWNGNNWLNTGAAYNPALNSWRQLATTGAPSARGQHVAVWTGTEMVVWGGTDGGNLGSGARYNPASDTWTAIATTGAPGGRFDATAVWTGTEMIVWGGATNSTNFVTDGARYNPSTNTWTAVSGASAPAARSLHSAVWTGTQMIVWGGSSGSPFNNGGNYNPSTNTWSALSTSGAPSPRGQHTALWTGDEMIVWGGYANNAGPVNDGARYNPSNNTWTSVATAPLSERNAHIAVWTGNEMIVWGGANSSGYMDDNARYKPSSDSWSTITTTGAPPGRYFHTAVWTGDKMLIWGGIIGAHTVPWSYTLPRTMYLYARP